MVGRFVCLCVCLLFNFVSPAKTAEPIKMPFGAESGGLKEALGAGFSTAINNLT